MVINCYYGYLKVKLHKILTSDGGDFLFYTVKFIL